MSAEIINNVLGDLKKIKGVHGCALFDKFGLIQGTLLPSWVDPDAVSTMVVLILKSAERAAKELKQGKFYRALIENERGKILFLTTGERVIVIISSPDAKVGYLILKIEAAESLISQL